MASLGTVESTALTGEAAPYVKGVDKETAAVKKAVKKTDSEVAAVNEKVDKLAAMFTEFLEKQGAKPDAKEEPATTKTATRTTKAKADDK